MDAARIDAASRIQAILGPLLGHAAPLPRQQDLGELGLTSMQMVNLMLSIEAEFDVLIPPAKLMPANFRTIENIETLVRELAH